MNSVFKFTSIIIISLVIFFTWIKVASSTTEIRAKGWQGIIIEEIFPNPYDKDKDKEWIRLYNSANTEINLKGWFLIDSYGRGDAYLFTEDLFLEDDDYLILKRSETNITLNNFKEKLYLYTNEDKLADSVMYINAPEDKIYKYTKTGFVWQDINQNNNDKSGASLDKSKEEIKDSFKDWTFLNEGEAEDLFKLQGHVITEPGDLSNRYFLLSKDNQQSQVIQVYNHSSSFSHIESGDIIEIKGRLSKLENNLRIKTKDIEDIQILKSSFLVKPINFNLNNLETGKIYQINALVNKVNKNSIEIIYNDKTIKVDITLMDSVLFTKDQQVQLIGLLLKNNQDLYLKLLPYYPQNLKYSNNKSSLHKNKKNTFPESKDYKNYLALLSVFALGVMTLRQKK